MTLDEKKVNVTDVQLLYFLRQEKKQTVHYSKFGFAKKIYASRGYVGKKKMPGVC